MAIKEAKGLLLKKFQIRLQYNSNRTKANKNQTLQIKIYEKIITKYYLFIRKSYDFRKYI
jgi:hypothetical protein